MKILHYTIGFSPERTGGLPRYATDLMEQQVKDGHQVFALYPGRINILKRKSYIKKSKKFNYSNIQLFELINSLPLPLFGGIKEPKDFMTKTSSRIYESFLKYLDVDVIHVHTLMGIHKEFFEVAKKMNTKIVFTSHDYYGLSPVPDFFLNGKSWDSENSNQFWNNSAASAMTTFKLRIFQLSFYSTIRKFFSNTRRMRENEKVFESTKKDIDIRNFEALRNYYEKIFKMVDIYHFNSNISKSVFLNNFKWIENKRNEVITITNASIQKNIDKNKTPHKITKIAYIGPYQENKGFYEFIKFAEKNKDKKFSFFVYGGNVKHKLPSYIINKGKYKHNEIKEIFSNIDLVLIPSLWKETFGFVTLEAISYGIPVMVSANVGSKLLLDSSQVFENVDNLIIPKEFKIDPLCVKTISFHSDEIIQLYNSEK